MVKRTSKLTTLAPSGQGQKFEINVKPGIYTSFTNIRSTNILTRSYLLRDNLHVSDNLINALEQHTEKNRSIWHQIEENPLEMGFKTKSLNSERDSRDENTSKLITDSFTRN